MLAMDVWCFISKCPRGAHFNVAATWPLLGIVKKKSSYINLSSKRQPQKLSVAKTQVFLYYIVFRFERGNHRSCQSPRHKCSDSTPCFVFEEATTEAVSRQYARALILHCVLYSKRQPQKLSAAKTQLLLYYMCYSRWWCSQRRSVLTFFFLKHARRNATTKVDLRSPMALGEV